MPIAVPGVGECKICFEIVPSVKVLDCGHSLCLPCATKIIETRRRNQQQQSENVGSVSGAYLPCPECRCVTDCGQQGARALKTRFFGQVKCDVCLEKKDTEDCWWCGQCVRTLCSKCSIKEHSKKGHSISEWNKLEPVKYSINYINQMKLVRKGTTDAEHNRAIVKCFLGALEEALNRELSCQPELDRLQNDLLERYGGRFNQQQQQQQHPLALSNRAYSSSPDLLATKQTPAGASSPGIDDGPRVVAKVMQLAGANVLETLVPALREQIFQLHFTVSPDEAAKYLRSKIEFIPLEEEEPIAWRKQVQNGGPSPVRRSCNSFMEKIGEDGCGEDPRCTVEEIFMSPSTQGKGAVVEVDYDERDWLALRYASGEVFAVNVHTKRTLSTVPVQMKHECRSVTFSRSNGHLYMALQSTVKRHEWTLEAIDLTSSPSGVLFATPFDIDPEDRVENVQLCAGEPGVLYEVRACTKNVSEVWRACLDRKGKTGSKVKLKETMMYQKDEARFSRVLVAPGRSGSKEQTLLAWDDLSRGLYRLTVRDKRCYCCTKIITSPVTVPFSLDTHGHLWIYDPCTSALSVTTSTVLNKTPVAFRKTRTFAPCHLHQLWAHSNHDFLFAVHLAADWKSVKLIKYRKDTEGAQGPSHSTERKPPAPVKRRSFSARV